MHLDENDVARYVDGRITEAERREMEAHLAECPECSEQVAEAHRFLDEIPEQRTPTLHAEVQRKAETLGTEENGERAQERWASRATVIAGVLVLLIGVAGGLYWQSQESPQNQLRSPSGERILGTRAPADGARVRERPVFVCEKVSETLAYRVTLYKPDGTVLWKKDTTASRIPLPTSVSLTEDRTYLWRATALQSDGSTLRSDLQTFTYAP